MQSRSRCAWRYRGAVLVAAPEALPLGPLIVAAESGEGLRTARNDRDAGAGRPVGTRHRGLHAASEPSD